MVNKVKCVPLLMLALSLGRAMANATESVDLFTLLDETCPYWQVKSSWFHLQVELA